MSIPLQWAKSLFFVCLSFVLINTVQYAILPLLIIPLLLSIKKGVEISAHNGQYRHYTRTIFGVRGKWRDLDPYEALVIKTITGKQKIYNDLAGSAGEFRDSNFELYLMSSSHRTQLYLQRFNSYDKAIEKAHELSASINFPIENYSPKRISRKRKALHRLKITLRELTYREIASCSLRVNLKFLTRTNPHLNQSTH